jgi:hypothetical protein
MKAEANFSPVRKFAGYLCENSQGTLRISAHPSLLSFLLYSLVILLLDLSNVL